MSYDTAATAAAGTRIYLSRLMCHRPSVDLLFGVRPAPSAARAPSTVRYSAKRDKTWAFVRWRIEKRAMGEVRVRWGWGGGYPHERRAELRDQALVRDNSSKKKSRAEATDCHDLVAQTYPVPHV